MLVSPIRVRRASLLIFALSALTLALGFAVQVLLAATLGTGRSMDILLVALTFPTVIASLAMGVPALILVPLVPRALADGDPAVAAALGTGLAVRGALLAAAVAVMLAAAAPEFVHLVAPGFAPGDAAASAHLLRILAAGSFCDVLRGLLSGLSLSRGRFLRPFAAPALNHLFMLAAILTFADRYGPVAIAFGWTAGSIAMLLLLLPGHGLRLIAAPAPMTTAGRLLGPALVYTVCTQAVPWVDRLVASMLPAGSISFIGYGGKLLDILLRTSPMALILSYLPVLAGRAAAGTWSEFRAGFVRVLRLVTLTTVPLALTVAFLAGPIVVLLFQRGAFDAASSAGVSRAVAWYGLALLPAALVSALSNGYVALGAHAALARWAVVGLAAVAALDIVLSHWFGFVGIPIAFAATSSLLVVVLSAGLRRWPVRALLEGQRRFVLGIAGAAAPLAAVLTVGRQLIARGGTVWWAEAWWTAAVVALAWLAYGIALRLLGVPEMSELATLASRALRRTGLHGETS